MARRVNMAPEQAAGRKDLTVAVDVYSLGVVLYERLTGHTPFTGETVLELLRQAREEEPPRPSSICPGMDRDLETICLKCLEKDPAKRYSSAEALQNDLERWLRGEPIEARPVGQAGRLWRWCRRNPAVASLASGLAAALLAGTVISLTFGFRERKERIRAEQAEGGLEQALARSLVRPLKIGESRFDLPREMSEPEAEALWELAENPGERLWLRFVSEALRTPLTIKQLHNRAEPAWIAAVGLDVDKRKRVEELLIERLNSGDLSTSQRYDLTISALSLGELAPASLQMMVDILVAWWGSNDEYLGREEVANRLVEITEHLQADASARILISALEQAKAKTNFGFDLGPEQIRPVLAQGLAVVAGRMQPAEAARVLTQALHKETEETAREWLGQGLAEVARRMEPAAAAPVLERAASVLTDSLEKTRGGNRRIELCQRLATVAAQMESAQATRVLTRALVKELHAEGRKVLACNLSAMAGRMEPREAARIAGQAASILAQALEKETRAPARKELAQGLAALATKMEPREAERVAGQAASILAQALEKETRAPARKELAQGLAAVAARMEPREAARVLGRAASILTQALEKTTDAIARHDLAEKLATLAERMEPREAARVSGQAASILTPALEKAKDTSARTSLARGLAAVAGRMEPLEAARVLGRAASILTLALEKETDASDLSVLAYGLSVIVRLLSRAKAVTVCHPVIQALLQTLETEKDESNRLSLAMAVTDLLSSVDGMEASHLSREIAFAICSGRLANASQDMDFPSGGSETLDALLTDDSRSAVSHRAAAVATLMGLVNYTPFSALTALPTVSELLPCRLSTQDLVELLKMPTCFGEARKVVLKHLGNRYGRVFANHWEFVRYAQEQHLDLDLTSPPKRWRRP